MKWNKNALPLLLAVLLLSGCTRTTIEGTFVPTGKNRNNSPSIGLSKWIGQITGGPVSLVFEDNTVDSSLIPLGPHPFAVREEKVWVLHPGAGSEVPVFRIQDSALLVDPWGSTYRLAGGGDGVRERIDWPATGGVAIGGIALAVAVPFLAAWIKRRRDGKRRTSGPRAHRPKLTPRPKPPAPDRKKPFPASFKKPDPAFLSETEKHCLTALARAGGDRLLVFPKVHPAGFLAGYEADASSVLDLLLCDPDSLEPFAAIQLVENRLRDEKRWKALGDQLRGQGILFEAVSPTIFYSPARLDDLISELLQKRRPGRKIE